MANKSKAAKRGPKAKARVSDPLKPGIVSLKGEARIGGLPAPKLPASHPARETHYEPPLLAEGEARHDNQILRVSQLRKYQIDFWFRGALRSRVVEAESEQAAVARFDQEQAQLVRNSG